MEETFGACALFENSEMLYPDWLRGELTSESPTNHSLLLICSTRCSKNGALGLRTK